MSGISRSRVVPLHAGIFWIVEGSHSSCCARLRVVGFRNPARLLDAAPDSVVANLTPGPDSLCASATPHDGFSSRSQHHRLATHRLWAATRHTLLHHRPRISVVVARDGTTSRATASLRE